jgi:hypothetical protein
MRATLAVIDRKQGEPVVRLTTGLAFHTEGAVTSLGRGHEAKINLGALEKLLLNVSTAD